MLNQYKHLKWVGYVIVSILLITGWVFWAGPEIKKLPGDFTYSANILSLDNFYDEKAQKFLGPHISKTVFNYQVIANNPTYLTIKNSFNVSTLNNHPIFSVVRVYFTDPDTGQHVVIPGQEKRSGYLFAPHYASKKPFYYWHINYDAPALMQYIGKETINGLTVYHYQAEYEADQTANLTQLPGVPEKRGIRARVALQLWIEPVSGWLIKYQDDTLAYFYDKKTGQYLVPWNHFSNRYTQVSINQKVHEAVWLKWKFLIVDFFVPILILLMPACLFFRSNLKKITRHLLLPTVTHYQQNRRAITLGIVSIALFIALLGSAYYLFWYRKPPALFTIGISQWNNNIELTTAIRGFKDGLADYGFDEGKNVQYIIQSSNSNIVNEIGIIQSFVKDKVDMIFTTTTQGTLVAKGSTTRIPIIFTDVSYPAESGIISSPPPDKTNIVGTLNYILPAIQFFQFDITYPHTKILGFVHHTGDPDSAFQYQEYKETLHRRNIEVVDISAIDVNDMKDQLTQALASSHFDALFIACDTLIQEGGGKIAAEFSIQNKIPSLTCDKDSVNEGAMMGYFADPYSIGRQAGIKAALILRGAEPSWLHIESPADSYLMVNVATARTLGIPIPAEVRQKANAMIDH